MKLLLAAAGMAIAIGLSGCTTLQQAVNDIGTVANASIVNPIDNAQVTQLGNALGTVQAVVVGYAALPLCAKGHALSVADACHDKALLVALDGDMHVAVAAYKTLTDYQAAHPKGTQIVGGGFSALLSQAKAAVATVQSLVNAYKIGA